MTRTRDFRVMAPGAALPAAGAWLVPPERSWDGAASHSRLFAMSIVAKPNPARR